MFSKDPIILFWICKTASQYSYCSKMQLYELILLLLYIKSAAIHTPIQISLCTVKQ